MKSRRNVVFFHLLKLVFSYQPLYSSDPGEVRINAFEFGVEHICVDLHGAPMGQDCDYDCQVSLLPLFHFSHLAIQYDPWLVLASDVYVTSFVVDLHREAFHVDLF